MKRVVIALLCVLTSFLRSQCTYSCSSYSVSPITYSFIEVQGGNTVYLPDDDVSTTVPINFNFDFYCTTYNQVRIGSNGFITFDFGAITLSLTPYAQQVPNSADPNGVIAWNWNDLDPSSATGAGTISYTNTGVSPNQRFIVTYSAVPIWTNNAAPSNLRNTGQIILHESTNIIEIHIKEATNNGWLNHTEGIEDASATKGLAVPSRNQKLWNAKNSSHMFSPFAVTSTVIAGGTPSLCQGTQGQFTVNATPPPQYYTWALPPSWNGNSNSASITPTVGAAGVVSVIANYSCGASEQATFFVNVIPAPKIAFSSVSPTLLCGGQPINVVVNGAATYTLNPGNYSGGATFTALATASGVQTLSGTSSAGCLAFNAPTVALNVKPSPTVTLNSGEICLGDSFVITPSGAFSYEFIVGFPVMEPTAPGVYSVYVVGTGTNFCKSQPALSTVTVHALPVITVVPTRSYICRGETTTLTATGAISYIWAHNFSTSPVTIVSPSIMTNYIVSGTDEHGCMENGSKAITVSSCVGLEERGESNTGVTIYPNPGSGPIRIEGLAGNYIFELRDVLGKIIFSKAVNDSDQWIDLCEVPPGTYFYMVLQTTGFQRGKLIRN